jgi:uncharacterized protein YcsI (UPF0317 family)
MTVKHVVAVVERMPTCMRSLRAVYCQRCDHGRVVKLDNLSPADFRARFRAGLRMPTASCAPGFAQANLMVLPQDAAGEFERFARHNPGACPLLDVTAPGNPATRLAADADLRTDVPAYRIWEHGRCVAEPSDIAAYWRDDLVAFLTGCSFTFEKALLSAGVPVRHLEQGTIVPMFITNRPCEPSGRFAGPLVVSMRPVPAALVATATAVTARYPASHGAPVHAGDPADLGIADLSRPDFGEPVQAEAGDVPVYWACGVTPQAAMAAAQLPFAVTHAPGHMLITDIPDIELVTSTAPAPGNADA